MGTFQEVLGWVVMLFLFGLVGWHMRIRQHRRREEQDGDNQ